MTVDEASEILKMLLGYLKGEIEPPSPKTIEEAKKFEQDGYECLNIAIRSLEAWEKVKEGVEILEERLFHLPNSEQAYAAVRVCMDIINDNLKGVEQ